MAKLQVSYNDPNLSFNNWIEVFVDFLNKHAPVKSKRVKHETQPKWLMKKLSLQVKPEMHITNIKNGVSIKLAE